jgi:hypothetical protein
MMVVAIKEFTANGIPRERWELFDASNIRNADTLVAQRYIRHATSDEIASAVREDSPDSSSERRPSRSAKRARGLVAKRRR